MALVMIIDHALEVTTTSQSRSRALPRAPPRRTLAALDPTRIPLARDRDPASKLSLDNSMLMKLSSHSTVATTIIFRNDHQSQQGTTTTTTVIHFITRRTKHFVPGVVDCVLSCVFALPFLLLLFKPTPHILTITSLILSFQQTPSSPPTQSGSHTEETLQL